MASMMNKVGAGADATKRKLDQVSSAASGLGNILKAAGISFGAFQVLDMMKEGVEKVHSLHQAEAQLANTMQNMGVYSQEAYEKAIKGASDLAKSVLFSNSDIIGLQSQLRMVGNVGENEMNRLTMASADMATKFGLGLADAGNAIAKAVNNPEMMRRLAMQLKIDPHTVDTIQNIAKAGHEAQARLMLLDVVQQKVGGAAQAAFNADPLARFNKTMGSIKMTLGEVAISIQKTLAPVIEILAVLFQNSVKWITGTFGGMLNSISAVISGLFDKIRQNSDSIMSVISPLVNIVKDIFSTFRELFNIIQTMDVATYFQPLSDLLSNYIVPLISQLWNFIKDIVLKVVDFVSKSTLLRDIWLGIVEFVKELISLVSLVIDGLKWLFDNVVMPILNGIEKAYRLIKGYKDTEIKVTVKNPIKPIAPATIPGTNNAIVGAGGMSGTGGTGSGAGKDTAKSIATGGTKTTNVTINFGSLIAGGFTVNASDIKEGAAKMRDVVLDELTRTLAMAQAI